MLSKQLENLLRELSGRDPAEISERFQKARGHSLLPADETTPFSDRQVASALLSLVPERPGYAGLHALVLSNLQPVGGPEASFQGAKNLGDAIALAIARPDDFLELEVLDGEFGVNLTPMTGRSPSSGHREERTGSPLVSPSRKRMRMAETICMPSANPITMSSGVMTLRERIACASGDLLYAAI